MLCPYGTVVLQDMSAPSCCGGVLPYIEKVNGAGPSQRTLGESPKDSRDGPGATKSGTRRSAGFLLRQNASEASHRRRRGDLPATSFGPACRRAGADEGAKRNRRLRVRLVRGRDVGAGKQGAVVVAGRQDDVALLAEFGEVVAQEGLQFLGADGVEDVGLYFVQGL
jgi:hypothetical protein